MARLVDQRAAFLEEPKEHLQIAAAVGRGADVERRIEDADAIEQPAAERHVGATAKATGAGVSDRRSLARHGIDAEIAAIEAAAEAAVVFEQPLCLHIDLVGDDEPGRRVDAGPLGTTGQRVRPSLIDAHVVVGERDDIAARFGNRAIAGPIEAWTRLET